MIIYVSAPFSKGDQFVNVRNACLAGDEILKKGHIPLVPHLTALWHAISPKSWEEWMEIDTALLSMCDALVRLPGESKGADMEVAEAKKLHLIIYDNLEQIPKHWGVVG